MYNVNRYVRVFREKKLILRFGFPRVRKIPKHVYTISLVFAIRKPRSLMAEYNLRRQRRFETRCVIVVSFEITGQRRFAAGE